MSRIVYIKLLKLLFNYTHFVDKTEAERGGQLAQIVYVG